MHLYSQLGSARQQTFFMTAQHKVALILCFDVRLVISESMLLYLTSGPSDDRTNNYAEYELVCEPSVSL